MAEINRSEVITAIKKVTFQTKLGLASVFTSSGKVRREHERAAMRKLFELLGLPKPTDIECDSYYPW